MDAEMRDYLDAMQQTLVRRMEQLDAQTRAHAERLNTETRAHAERLNTETRAHAERLNAETRRELGVLIETVDDKVRLVAEGVANVNEKLDRFVETAEQRLARLEAHLP